MTINRRTVLKGMLGGALVSVALPPLEVFFNATGTAYADGGALPRRFGLFFWGNGVVPSRWVPTSTGAGDAWSLSEQLAPLAGLKEHLTVVSGMAVKTPNVVPHTSGAAGILSGAPLRIEGGRETFQLPSIDQIIAAGIGGATRFSSIEFGAKPQSGLSYNGPDNQNPPESSPIALFERIFGAGFRAPGEDAEVDPRLALRRSVLDAVLEDATRMQGNLGVADRIRLEQHFDGIRALELRIARLEEDPPNLDACARPTAPASDYPDIDGRPQLQEKNRIMSDVIAMALACDQTRVISNFITHPVNNLLFDGASAGHHQLTHDEPGDQPEVNGIVVQLMEEYAYFLEALRRVPEGDGTLLDNCAILGTSDVSLGRLHSLDEFPIVLAGSACGALRNNFHYRSAGGENASKVMLTLVRAMGVNTASFGAEDGEVSDTLGAIEA